MSAIADVQKLRQETTSKLTWEDAARVLGWSSGEALRSECRRESARAKEVKDQEELEQSVNSIMFHDKKHREAVSWRDLAKHAIKTQTINEKLSDHQRTASITIKSKKPVAIVFTGDWHFGDSATDHQQWYKDMEEIVGTENLYMIDLGDSIQNMRSFKTLSAVLGQALTPPQQASAMASLIDELSDKKKVLAKVDGNHDGEFDERIFGEALQKYYRDKLEAPVFNNKGILKLTIGSEEYWLVLFHKSRFSSIFRPAHGAAREAQMFAPADIIAGAHDHMPAMEVLPLYTAARDAGMGIGGMTYLLKVGTYQDSEFGWKYFHNGGYPMNWTAVLWPKDHKIQIFGRTSDAVKFISTFN